MKNPSLVVLYTALVISSICIQGCEIGAGTLGAFEPVSFDTDKKTLQLAIDTLYTLHPEYSIPDKWKDYDDWSARGFGFLDGRVLYLASPPEEMYYITILGGERTRLSIRAVHNGRGRWLKEQDFSTSEKERIQKRFDMEVVSKLEQLTKSKSSKSTLSEGR
jgi:hypothetical protein